MKFALVLGVLFTAFVPPVHACRFESIPLTERVMAAQTVFIGRVLEDSVTHGPLSTALFQVGTVVKGHPGLVKERIRVNSSSDTCGLHFTKGETWFIVAGNNTTTNAASPVVFTDATKGSLLMAYPDGRHNMGNAILIDKALMMSSRHTSNK